MAPERTRSSHLSNNGQDSPPSLPDPSPWFLTLVAAAPVLLPLRKVLGLFLPHLQGHLFMDWNQGPRALSYLQGLAQFMHH